MAFPAIQAAYPQSYPQDLWIDKKELKKRGLSALVDISHEVGWRLGLHQQKITLWKILPPGSAKQLRMVVSCDLQARSFLAYSQNGAIRYRE